MAFLWVLFTLGTCFRVDLVFSREALAPSCFRANHAIYFLSPCLLVPSNCCSQGWLRCFQLAILWIPVTVDSSQNHWSPGWCSRPSPFLCCLYPLHADHTWPQVYLFQSPFQLICTCSFFKTSHHTIFQVLVPLHTQVFPCLSFNVSSSYPFQNPHQTVLAWPVLKPASPLRQGGGGLGSKPSYLCNEYQISLLCCGTLYPEMQNGE